MGTLQLNHDGLMNICKCETEESLNGQELNPGGKHWVCSLVIHANCLGLTNQELLINSHSGDYRFTVSTLH